jgi:hypothetical protein
MMRAILLVLLPAAALAQTAPATPASEQKLPTPTEQALQNMWFEASGARASWQARAIADEATIAELRKELEALKAAQEKRPP